MTATRDRLLDRLPVTEHTVSPAGVPTAVLEGGQGPPMVLLHGQGEFAATWMRVIPRLAATHRVIVPDLPGHGASRLGEGRLGRDRALDWLDELIERSCPQPPVVVGHLLGGGLAARLAIRQPAAIDRLVLVDTLGLRWYRPSPSFGLALVAFGIRPTERSRDRLFDRCFADFDGIRREMGDEMELLAAYALECAQGPRLTAALRALMPAVGMAPIPGHELAAMRTPTALIWGRQDLQTPVATAQAAAERYGWPLHVIDGAADDPAHEKPHEFLTALHDILAGRDQTPASRTPG